MAMGGVGEAMLIGAAVGGGSAALTGGDPLKGALLGGLTGGAGAGISGALAGAGAGTAAGTTAAATEGALAAGTGAGAGAGTGAGVGAGIGIDTLAAQNIAANPALYPAGSTAANTATLFTPTGQSYAIPSATSNVMPPAMSSFQTAMQNPMAYIKANPLTMASAGLAGATGARREFEGPDDEYTGPLSRFRFNPDTYRPAYLAEGGGIASLSPSGYDRMVGDMPMYQKMARGGGISDLGSYSDGGRMLRGPGDGMSDSIPGVISGKRPARLADGEFVVPADVVSGLGNGSTDAGARQLYAMMDKVRKDRTGTKRQGRQINPRKYVPA